MHMTTSNSKYSSFLYKKKWKYLLKRESTHVNEQSCPSNEKMEYTLKLTEFLRSVTTAIYKS